MSTFARLCYREMGDLTSIAMKKWGHPNVKRWT